MFNGSFLRVCRILRFVKKIRFCLLESGRTKPWCPGLVSRPSAKAQEPMARSTGLDIQHPKLSVGAYFELQFLGCGFLIHLSNRSDSPRFRAPSPVEEDTPKIQDTTGTVFIQGTSIVLPVWRCIMFNGSFLRVCWILRFVKKIRFCLLESGRTKPWCLGLVSPRVWFPYSSFQQVRQPSIPSPVEEDTSKI